MGQKGSWKEEGYTFKIEDSSDGFFGVRCLSSDGEQVGLGLFRVNTEMVGWTEIKPENSLHVTSVDVDPNHQRKGLATEMYRLIEEYSGKPILPSFFQTPAAQAFWAARRK